MPRGTQWEHCTERHPCLHTEIRAHRSSQGRAVCSLTAAPGCIPPRGGGGAPSHRVPPKEREWCGLNNISELSRELWEPSGALGSAERHQPGCPSYSYTHRGQIRNKFSIKWKSAISHAPINYCSTGSRNGKAVSKPRARKSSKMFTEEVFNNRVNYRYDKVPLSGKAKQSVYSYSHFFRKEEISSKDGPSGCHSLPLLAQSISRHPQPAERAGRPQNTQSAQHSPSTELSSAAVP